MSRPNRPSRMFDAAPVVTRPAPVAAAAAAPAPVTAPKPAAVPAAGGGGGGGAAAAAAAGGGGQQQRPLTEDDIAVRLMSDGAKFARVQPLEVEYDDDGEGEDDGEYEPDSQTDDAHARRAAAAAPAGATPRAAKKPQNVPFSSSPAAAAAAAAATAEADKKPPVAVVHGIVVSGGIDPKSAVVPGTGTLGFTLDGSKPPSAVASAAAAAGGAAKKGPAISGGTIAQLHGTGSGGSSAGSSGSATPQQVLAIAPPGGARAQSPVHGGAGPGVDAALAGATVRHAALELRDVERGQRPDDGNLMSDDEDADDNVTVGGAAIPHDAPVGRGTPFADERARNLAIERQIEIRMKEQMDKDRLEAASVMDMSVERLKWLALLACFVLWPVVFVCSILAVANIHGTFVAKLYAGFGGTFAVTIPLLCIISVFLRARTLTGGSLTFRQALVIVIAALFVFAATVPAGAALGNAMSGYYEWKRLAVADSDEWNGGRGVSVDAIYGMTTHTPDALAGVASTSPEGTSVRYDAFYPSDGAYATALGGAYQLQPYQDDGWHNFYAVPLVSNATADFNTTIIHLWAVTEDINPNGGVVEAPNAIRNVFPRPFPQYVTNFGDCGGDCTPWYTAIDGIANAGRLPDAQRATIARREFALVRITDTRARVRERGAAARDAGVSSLCLFIGYCALLALFWRFRSTE